MTLAVTIGGWIGAAVLLAAYGLVTTNRLRADSAPYLLANTIGSIGLGLSAAVAGAWPPVAVNSIWFLLGIAPLARAVRSAHRRRTSSSRTITDPAQPTPA